MTKKEIEKEWERLNFEVFENRPETGKPYPTDIVQRRELLLLAQVHLTEILWAKQNKNLTNERFHTKVYNLIIKMYFEWEK